MLEVGVAVRLHKLPSEVRAAPWEDVLLVAAYCQLEAEQYERNSRRPVAAASTKPARGSATTMTTEVRYVARATKKG